MANDTLDQPRPLQRTRYRAAKASPTRRCPALYDQGYREARWARAWPEVTAHAGTAGGDGQTIAAIERQGVTGFLTTLATDRREGRDRPTPVRRVFSPKAKGTQRPLGIPTVRDRVVPAAAKVGLAPIVAADFRERADGVRPQRSAHQAVAHRRQVVNRG